jgi:hypothetical protein
MTLDVKKRNSSNETPNVMTVGVEKYGLRYGRSSVSCLWVCHKLHHYYYCACSRVIVLVCMHFFTQIGPFSNLEQQKVWI